jgi:phosphoesterase RecJ-like protein
MLPADPRYGHFADHLRRSKGVIVVAHRKPDGDTLGAAAAVLHACASLGVPATGFCVDRPAPQYRFLPGSERFTSDAAVFEDRRYNTIAVFDASDLVHAGVEMAKGKRERGLGKTVINVDHHATNERFGDMNLVDESAASTTEVVYRACIDGELRITPEMATCLLAGLLTDTGNLTNPATTAGAFATASALLAAGGRLRETGNRLERNKSAAALRVWGRALDRLKWHAATGVASTAVFAADLAAEGVGDEVMEGLSNVLGGNLDVPVVLVLKEQPGGKVKVSFRTARDIDVGAVALALGGGGHKKAAGAVMIGKIVEEVDRWTVVRS